MSQIEAQKKLEINVNQKGDSIVGKSQTSYTREYNSSIINFENQESDLQLQRQNSIQSAQPKIRLNAVGQFTNQSQADLSPQRRQSIERSRILNKSKHQWETLFKHQKNKHITEESSSLHNGPDPKESSISKEIPKPVEQIIELQKVEPPTINQSQVTSINQEQKQKIKDQIQQMEETVEDMQIKLERGLEEIEVFKKLFLSRATEKAIGTYMNIIGDSLHKECGEKPFQNKLDQPNMLQEFYQTEDSLLLMNSMQKMSDKFEIIGLNLINQKKFKSTVTKQIETLEQQSKKHVLHSTFLQENHEIEKRLQNLFMENIQHLQNDLNFHKEELVRQVKYFEEKLGETQKETLWKIRDAEQLLETRISEQKVNDLLLNLKKEIFQDIKLGDDKLQILVEKIEKEVQQAQNQFQFKNEIRMIQLVTEVTQFRTEIKETVKNQDFLLTASKLDNLKLSMESELDQIQTQVRENQDKQIELIKKFQILIESDNIAQLVNKNQGLSILQQKSHQLQQNLSPQKEISSLDQDSPQKQSINKKNEIKVESRQSFLRMESFKDYSLKNLTRKEKEEAYESKIIDFEEGFIQIQDQLNQINEQLKKKASKIQIEKLQSEKLSIDKFHGYIPEYLLLDNLKSLINQSLGKKNQEILSNLDDFKMACDQKITKIRQEFDMSFLRKSIEKKANITDVKPLLDNFDLQFIALEQKVLQFQEQTEQILKVNKKHSKNIQELQEVNKDVLLGKKALKCLSCFNNSNDYQQKSQQIKGADGRIYMGINEGKKKFSQVDEDDEFIRQSTQIEGSTLKPFSSPKQVFRKLNPNALHDSIKNDLISQKNSTMRLSMNGSIINNQQFNNYLDSNLYENTQEGQRQSKNAFKNSNRYNLAAGEDNNKKKKLDNRATSENTNYKKQPKLPIGFRVQQEKRSEIPQTTAQSKLYQQQKFKNFFNTDISEHNIIQNNRNFGDNKFVQPHLFNSRIDDKIRPLTGKINIQNELSSSQISKLNQLSNPGINQYLQEMGIQSQMNSYSRALQSQQNIEQNQFNSMNQRLHKNRIKSAIGMNQLQSNELAKGIEAKQSDQSNLNFILEGLNASNLQQRNLQMASTNDADFQNFVQIGYMVNNQMLQEGRELEDGKIQNQSTSFQVHMSNPYNMKKISGNSIEQDLVYQTQEKESIEINHILH